MTGREGSQTNYWNLQWVRGNRIGPFRQPWASARPKQLGQTQRGVYWWGNLKRSTNCSRRWTLDAWNGHWNNLGKRCSFVQNTNDPVVLSGSYWCNKNTYCVTNQTRTVKRGTFSDMLSTNYWTGMSEWRTEKRFSCHRLESTENCNTPLRLNGKAVKMCFGCLHDRGAICFPLILLLKICM